MNTNKIYEKIMLEVCFNEIKQLRNQWNNDVPSERKGISSIIDIGGSDHDIYSFIMKRCEECIYEMLPAVIVALIKEYKIQVQYYSVMQRAEYKYIVSDNQEWDDTTEQGDNIHLLLFSRKDTEKPSLYIFKKYGISNQMPITLVKEIMESYSLTGYKYVCYVDDKAYEEIINHSEDEKDPTRGTNILSMKLFFEEFFGADEYIQFKKYAICLSEKVKDYFGFAIVRTLRPNTMHNFRDHVRSNLLNYVNTNQYNNLPLSKKQKEVISKRFFTDKNYEILLGSSDFAQSFMTSEWLYESLSQAGNIDLTPIAMGYFKAVEQILFKFLTLHTKERDGASRTVYVGKGKPYADAKGNALLDDALVNDDEKVKDLSLGSLTGFFGFYDTNKSCYYDRNKDILCNLIDSQTYHFIIDSFGKIVGLRNGFFHKHNLLDWKKVQEAQDTAYLVCFLLLGAYQITERDSEFLGKIKSQKDDYYKLCEYMHKKAMSDSGLAMPIFYLNGQKDIYGFWKVYRDDFISFDTQGVPIYSGVYFCGLDKKEAIRKATKDNMPNEIWEGELIISKSLPITITPSGPITKIYENGKFLG